jgi:hypothetical protein
LAVFNVERSKMAVQSGIPSGASRALWIKPANPAHPFRDELRQPLGRWVVACRPCRGWLGEPSLWTGFARKAVAAALVAVLTACGGGASNDQTGAIVWPIAGPSASGTIAYPGPNPKFILPFVGQGVSTSFDNPTGAARTVDITFTMTATLHGPGAGRITFSVDTGDGHPILEDIPLDEGAPVTAQRVYTVVSQPGQAALVQSDAFIDTAPGAASIDWSGATVTFRVR